MIDGTVGEYGERAGNLVQNLTDYRTEVKFTKSSKNIEAYGLHDACQAICR